MNNFWNDCTRKPKSQGLLAILDDEATPMISDVFVHDGGFITRSTAPRLNNERKRTQYHDMRSNKERASDERTAKEIANA